MRGEGEERRKGEGEGTSGTGSEASSSWSSSMGLRLHGLTAPHLTSCPPWRFLVSLPDAEHRTALGARQRGERERERDCAGTLLFLEREREREGGRSLRVEGL